MSMPRTWSRFALTLGLSLSAIVWGAGHVLAAESVFLRLTDGGGTPILGGAVVEVERDSIVVLGVGTGVTIPVDVATIQATGVPQWTGLTVSKLFDRASPRLLQALVRSEVFPRAELKFYIPGGDGLVLARTWILDGNVFVVALNSSTTSEGGISESLRLWSCRLTFRDELTGATGGVDFCTLSVF